MKQIKDSYKVTSGYERIYISKIIQNTVDDNGNKRTNRSAYSLAAEWFGHNFVYFFNQNDHARDVNLDYDSKTNDPRIQVGIISLMILVIL